MMWKMKSIAWGLSWLLGKYGLPIRGNIHRSRYTVIVPDWMPMKLAKESFGGSYSYERAGKLPEDTGILRNG